ncbi:hypothetical protein AWQ21_02325 [Picosynechococcus sp. PCC 7003]|nr:hypothetical protein AWQ21_02325 [Picosynechococcus sp. PCC 7003]
MSSLVFAIRCRVNDTIIEHYAPRGGDFNPLPLKYADFIKNHVLFANIFPIEYGTNFTFIHATKKDGSRLKLPSLLITGIGYWFDFRHVLQF